MCDQAVNILLAEDDDIDVRVVKRSFEKQALEHPIVVARDGVEALSLLRGENGNPPLEQPLMILLDLNMPRMGGLEFLKELRQDPELAKTIVFVLTTSNDDRDRVAAYESNVAGYLLKTDAGPDMEKHVPMLKRFLQSVRFPSEGLEVHQLTEKHLESDSAAVAQS